MFWSGNLARKFLVSGVALDAIRGSLRYRMVLGWIPWATFILLNKKGGGFKNIR
jgi:hypothetical protein